jgi:hypothetical protein
MNATRYALTTLLLCLAAAGCLDPGIYQGAGSPFGPSPASRPALAQAETGDIRVPPPRAAAETRQGDIHVFPATPTNFGSSPNNVAITVQKLGADQSSFAQAGLAFRDADERGVIQGGGPLIQKNGLRVGRGGPKLGGVLQVGGGGVRSTTNEQMFIVCASGTEGSIQVGADTFVQALGYWTVDGYQVLIERAFVGRSLVVRPTILPNGMVQVTLWPRFTTRGPRGAIDLTQLAATVVVRDGQPIVLGGLNSGREDIGAVLFGVGRETRTSTMTLILTPKIGGLPIEVPKGLDDTVVPPMR